MFHRLALTSSLILASSIVFNRVVLAESLRVPFSGIVTEQATFSRSTDTQKISVSNSYSLNGKTFKTLIPTAINFESSTPANISVSPPRLISGTTPDPNGTIAVSFLKFGSTKVSSDVNTPTATLPTGKTNFEVNMSVQRPGNFPPGNYAYDVTLTITP